MAVAKLPLALALLPVAVAFWPLALLMKPVAVALAPLALALSPVAVAAEPLALLRCRSQWRRSHWRLRPHRSPLRSAVGVSAGADRGGCPSRRRWRGGRTLWRREAVVGRTGVREEAVHAGERIRRQDHENGARGRARGQHQAAQRAACERAGRQQSPLGSGQRTALRRPRSARRPARKARPAHVRPRVYESNRYRHN